MPKFYKYKISVNFFIFKKITEIKMSLKQFQDHKDDLV